VRENGRKVGRRVVPSRRGYRARVGLLKEGTYGEFGENSYDGYVDQDVGGTPRRRLR
jgi:hypothetical protein